MRKKLRGRNRGNDQVENEDGEEESSKRGLAQLLGIFFM